MQNLNLMKQKTIKHYTIFIFLFVLINLNGTEAQEKYLQEIDENAPANTLTKDEEQKGWKLLFYGNKVTQILNDNVVVEYEKYSKEWKKLRKSGKWADYPDYGKYDKGHIALQNHSTVLSYRNIKIKEL